MNLLARFRVLIVTWVLLPIPWCKLSKSSDWGF